MVLSGLLFEFTNSEISKASMTRKKRCRRRGCCRGSTEAVRLRKALGSASSKAQMLPEHRLQLVVLLLRSWIYLQRQGLHMVTLCITMLFQRIAKETCKDHKNPLLGAAKRPPEAVGLLEDAPAQHIVRLNVDILPLLCLHNAFRDHERSRRTQNPDQNSASFMK